MIWLLRYSDASVAWALETARIWLMVFGSAVAAWLIGYGIGYRRGVNDAINGSLRKPDRRLSAK